MKIKDAGKNTIRFGTHYSYLSLTVFKIISNCDSSFPVSFYIAYYYLLICNIWQFNKECIDRHFLLLQSHKSSNCCRSSSPPLICILEYCCIVLGSVSHQLRLVYLRRELIHLSYVFKCKQIK